MRILNLLSMLVAIQSVFPQEKEISEFIAHYLRRIGFNIEIVTTDKNRPNLIATLGKADKYIGLYGHLDTVPNDFGERKEPFELKVKGNIAKGLGVEDMKGGIAAMIKAGEYAAEHKIPLKLIFGVDEEDISRGAHDLVNSGKLSDVGFLIVGESGQVPPTAKNFTVCYGRKGRILLVANIIGKKAHAAESEKGINAVEKAAVFLRLLTKMKYPVHPRLGKTKFVAHSINAETDSFSIPYSCQIHFSALTTPGINSKTLISDIKKIAEQNDIDVEVGIYERETPYGESYEVDLNNDFLKVLEKEIFTKFNVKPMYTSSVADENIFANRLNIPVISLGPIGGGGHTFQEWLDINSLYTVEEVYKKIITLHQQSSVN